MNARLARIVSKRHALVARSAAQREALAAHMAGLQGLVRIGNTAVNIGRTLRLHPALMAVAAATLLQGLVRGRRWLLWTGRALTAWELWRAVRTQWTRNRSA